MVAGYQACSVCGEWTVESGSADRRCADCRAEAADVARHLEVVHQVRDRTVVSRPTRARKRRKHKLTAAEREQRRLWNRARSRAIQRLVRIHRPLYQVLLAEEKERLGLDPRLDERSAGSAAIERSIAESA